ncbi:tRNA uracil 4-sulfurtransferase ThiI [Sutcliffiella rhizosphaerae]|uniref:Probable tRNA sulfurtransferase n=1 Tax=Sutcliffiella rhizosphaerae TaxID=2880967 RepID=A0ABM8YTQ1_9BACI|nr:tRNA uracil 4-sulfurtransferase ThiI [Sutcliffiella rhizosphaerae]CAG9623353.1 putative tRNA sulfurtransferase [Sutcliffiella rhizosphaerae]
MNYDHILIRFGELSTKGRNRKLFIQRLSHNIKEKIENFSKIKIEKSRDRMFIKLNGEPHEPIIEKLQSIFGIHSFSLAVKTKTEVEDIKKGALFAVHALPYKGKTFKVTAKRAFKQFELDTNELNYAIGSHILRNTEDLTVNVKEPDINVRVEVREDASYITCKDIEGAGGLPVGTSGTGVLMLSGGIDSPVAGYLAMKRGIRLEVVHFFSPPYTSERAKQKVMDLTEKLTAFGHAITVHIVPFTDIQVAIQKQIPENYTMTSTRRFMLKIADKILQKEGGLAIITGESLGQVASQTLESMATINEVTQTPIIRPLITMDKTEIMDIAKQIDTLDISNRPFEDCCTIFTPASPKTKPKKEKINFYESFFDTEKMIEDAVNRTEKLLVTGKKTEIESKINDLF